MAHLATAAVPELYHDERWGFYECLGCQEQIEVPRWAWLKVSGEKAYVRIAGQPENLMLWLEMHTLDHALCHLFKDAEKAREAREFRKERARRRLLGGQLGEIGSSKDRSGSASAGSARMIARIVKSSSSGIRRGCA